MSWWVYLEKEKDGRPVEVPTHSEGGTRCIPGTDLAELNITYNYGKHFDNLGLEDGLWSLNDMKAEDAIPQLRSVVRYLGTERSGNYWDSTPGNAGYALYILLCWATLYPEAVFRVS